MKLLRIFLIPLIILWIQQSPAQVNLVKISLPHLAWNSVNLSYERVINPNLSLNLTTNLQLPLSFDSGYRNDIIEEFNRNWELGYFREGVEWKGFDLTPEIRFYPGRNAEAPTGFFFSGMIKYSNYSWALPFHWRDDDVISFVYEGQNYVLQDVEIDIDADASTNALALGLGVGGQWILGDVIALGVDFALGWGFAWGEGTLTLLTETVEIPDQTVANELDQEALDILISEIAINAAEDVEEGLIEEDFPLSSQFNIDLSAEDNVVNADGTLPWAVLRFRITLGFAF